MRRSSKPERACTVIAPLVERLGIGEAVLLARMKRDWDRLFEEPLSLHMYPASVSEGTLVVTVDTPIWKQQLGFYKKEIVSKLAVYGVRDIRFRVGRIPKRSVGAPSLKEPARLTRDDELFIEGLTSTITDQTIRESVKNAAGKCLRASSKNKA